MALKGASKEDWAQMQTKTFTKWVDQKLKMRGSSINDVSTELSDGIKLHQLMEVLSHKNPGKYNSKPRIQVQKMENLQKVLSFIQNEEGIRLVNIGAGDIFEGNLNLIRGLIWALILHYQIGKGYTDLNQGDDSGASRPLSGKQLLLQYINSKIPHKNIKNFTTDWNDGTAVAALVDAHAPGLCPDADSIDPNNALQNATHAMKLAEDWLGIPQILAPEDLIGPGIDELSMMTYLSQYQQATVKEGAPGITATTQQLIADVDEPIEVVEEMMLESTLNETQNQQTDITKVSVYGSLIDSSDSVKIGKEATIFIDCTDSGLAPLSAKVTSTTDESHEDIVLQPSSSNPSIMTGTYSPKTSGEFKLEVKYNDEELSQSPYTITVPDDQLVQYQLIEVTGTGITGTVVGKQAIITVDCSRSGKGDITGTIELPSGSRKTLVFSPSDQSTTVVNSSYVPLETGIHQITIQCNGKTITAEPFSVNITADIDKVKGPFVTASGKGVKHLTKIIVDCSESGVAPITGKVKSPSGKVDKVVFKAVDDNSNVFAGFYEPEDAGQYELAVEFDDRPLPGSPVIVPVTDISKVKVSGSGVTGDGARVGKPANIIIDCSDSGVAPVSARFKDPSGKAQDIAFEPIADGPNVFEGSYQPEEAGEFEVGIDFDGRPLPSCPIKVPIKDASKVKVSGPGINGKGADVGKPAEIIVDCSESGVAPISAKVTTPTSDTKDVDFKPKAPGSKIYTGAYTPDGIGNHKVEVDFDNEPVENSPFTANIKDISKVKISGPGVTGEGVKPGNPAKVIVDCSESGVAPVCAKVKSPSGKVDEVMFEAVDNNPNVFAGFYKPEDAGQYELAVEFDDRPLPGSPVIVPVTDISKVKVSGSGITGDGACIGKPANIIVDCSDSGVAPVTARVKDPSGNVDDVTLLPKSGSPNVFEGSYFPKEPGTFETEVEFDGEPVPDSPYKAGIGKPENVRISGDGLDKAFVGEDNVIDVFTGDAGPGEVSVKFDGPPKAPPVIERVEKLDDDHYQIHFSPQSDGEYNLSVFYDNVQCDDGQSVCAVDLDKVQVTSPSTELLANTKVFFEVQSSVFNGEDFTISITDDCDTNIAYKIDNVNKEMFRVYFTPITSGNYSMAISVCGHGLKGSPYTATIAEETTHAGLSCSGNGLVNAIVDRKESFEIEIPDGYQGNAISVSVNGPGNVEISKEEEDGVLKITYTAPVEGVYEISVIAQEQEVNYTVEVEQSPSHSSPTLPPSPGPTHPIKRNHPVKRRYSIIPFLHIGAVILLAGLADQSAAVAFLH